MTTITTASHPNAARSSVESRADAVAAGSSEAPGAPTAEAEEGTRSAFEMLVDLQHSAPSNDEIKALVHQVIAEDLAEESISADYRVLIHYDDRPIEQSDTDKIHRAVLRSAPDKPILLVLNSGGGSIVPAYFIAKLCREHARDRFEIAVPRRAKSAATLMCCGADRIHMGVLSELGPIDPQFEGVPLLALKQSIEHLAELCKRYPMASGMLADYMTKSLRIEALGYYERIAESAAHYAERLLRSRRTVRGDDGANAALARHLVYAYKDHGFAIDVSEAAELFGPAVVAMNTPEYQLAERLYHTLDALQYVLFQFFDRDFAFTGDPSTGCTLIEPS